MSYPLGLSPFAFTVECPVVPLWQEVFKDDRHVLLEGFAYRPVAFIEFIQDAHRDGESLLCFGLLHQSQHRL